mmetsp:Transcript_34026/g.55463  ORF Transcript_34026/g.55463 Transcript_34026/m.55463 type:complete len:363 (-) Transcript_34026:37-1125(-)
MTAQSSFFVVCIECIWMLMGGFLDCPDNAKAVAKCTGTDCRKNAAGFRAGFTCNTWPFYAGGFPQWDKEDEYYLCVDWGVAYDLDATDNSSVISNAWCSEWISTEKSKQETETGSCKCVEDNSRYCLYWLCSQTEYQMGSTGASAYYECGQDSDGNPKYCYRDDSGEEVEVVQDSETSVCRCTNETSYEYCTEWRCEETSHNEYGHVELEIEHYRCVDRDQMMQYIDSSIIASQVAADYIDDICWAWTVDVESWDEFEVAECQCLEPHIEFDNAFCESWTCYEVGMHKRHNSRWYYFPLGMGLCAICGFCGCAIEGNFWYLFCFGVCGIFITLIWGGLPLFILWIALSICGICAGVIYDSRS